MFAAQHGLVTAKQARDFGLSTKMVARRITTGELDRPVSGLLRLTGAPRTWEQTLMVPSLASRGHAVISHRSAAALHDLDGSIRTAVEASVVRPRRLRIAGVIAHQTPALDPCDVITLKAIPVTGLARTLCDLGTVVPPNVVMRALDDCRRRGTSVRWLRATAERMHRPGQEGTGVLLSLLDQAEREPSVRGSWFEKLVEDCLLCPGLPALARQHRVYDSAGQLAGILDLAFPELRLGVEAHSRKFHFGRQAEHRDEDRDHQLARCGWEVLYVGWQGAKRPEDVLALVVDTARHRMATGRG